MGFLSFKALHKIKFKHLGKNVSISEYANFYNIDGISIGDNVRIDDFCILSAYGGIEIGNHVHIACYCALIGNKKIILKDFSGISSRVSIYSSTDTFSGEFMTGPTLPKKYIKTYDAGVIVGKHVVVGAGSIILPGVTLGDGSAIGAMSLVKDNIPKSQIAIGVPAKCIKKRSTRLFDLEKEFETYKKQ